MPAGARKYLHRCAKHLAELHSMSAPGKVSDVDSTDVSQCRAVDPLVQAEQDKNVALQDAANASYATGARLIGECFTLQKVAVIITLKTPSLSLLK